MRRFDRIGGKMMRRLNYYSDPEPCSLQLSESKVAPPPRFGAFWKEHDGGLDWYTSMFEGRIDQHLVFQRWFDFVNRFEPISSVLELGCGLGVGYADFFKDFRYVGVDLADQLIDWCRENRRNPKHEYWKCDFITEQFEERFDLVFSQGTIDNTYDMDAFLRATVGASKNWIYITAYRGFFSELSEHEYEWCEDQGVYYNNISPHKVYQTLKQCGCRNIMILPSYTGREELPFETVIVARVS
jgi:SAM-dependent methyltransferase